MRLGWVDFSDAERDKALNILHMLQEQGAVDELGIGVVRDAFADVFFPGTSTLLTRAKYYLVVPYIMREKIAEGAKAGWTVRQTMEEIDKAERKLGEKFWKAHQGEIDCGVIGRMAIAHHGWVKRAPSELYWNGIRTFGISGEREYSLPQYVSAALMTRRAKGAGLGTAAVGEADGGDDVDAGGLLRFKPFDLHGVYRKNWFSDVDIALRPEEARYLREKILANVPDSLFAVVLRENIELEQFNGDFAAFAEYVSKFVDKPMRDMLELACYFMRIVYGARVRYNVILQGDRSDRALKRWQDIPQRELVPEIGMMDQVFKVLDLLGKPQYAQLFKFLLDLEHSFTDRTCEKTDILIREREKAIKGSARAKLLHSEKFSAENWVGGYYLDYRLSETARIVSDIYAGLGVQHA